MVRDRSEVEEGELQIRETQVVRWRMGETLKPACHVIAEIADGAPKEWREPRRAGDGHACEQVPERRQGIAGTDDPGLASCAPVHARPGAAEQDRGFGADDRVPLSEGTTTGSLATLQQHGAAQVPCQALVELELRAGREWQASRSWDGRGSPQEGFA